MIIRGSVFWSVFAVLATLALLPILSVGLPPLFDYPNHLARMHILAEGGDRYYGVAWAAMPNLAEDLLVPPLAAVISLAAAAKLFLAMCLLLMALGPVLIARVLWGSWSAWSFGGFLMLYNRTLLWGFLNYLFGLGVALCGVALWLSIRQRSAPLRLAVGTLLATVCYFCHIEAAACYGLMVLGFEVAAANWRRSLVNLLQFLLPAALFLVSSHLVGAGPFHYADWNRKADLLFGVFDNYHRPVDVVSFIAVIGLIAGLIYLRNLKVNSGGLTALACLAAAYLFVPSQLFSGSGADHRLPPAMFLLFFAATQPSLERRAMTAIGAALALLYVVRVGLIEQTWLRANTVYEADLALLLQLPAGTMLAVVMPDNALNMVPIPEAHIPLMAVVERDAFVPTLFAYPAQQPVIIRAPYDHLAAELSPFKIWRSTADAASQALLSRFDYAVVVGSIPATEPSLACAQRVGGTPGLQLYKLQSQGCDIQATN